MSAIDLGRYLAGARDCLPNRPTQAEIADDIGVDDFSTLSHWENGRRLKNHIAFIKLCARYELSIEDLMDVINE